MMSMIKEPESDEVTKKMIANSIAAEERKAINSGLSICIAFCNNGETSPILSNILNSAISSFQASMFSGHTGIALNDVLVECSPTKCTKPQQT